MNHQDYINHNLECIDQDPIEVILVLDDEEQYRSPNRVGSREFPSGKYPGNEGLNRRSSQLEFPREKYPGNGGSNRRSSQVTLRTEDLQLYE